MSALLETYIQTVNALSDEKLASIDIDRPAILLEKMAAVIVDEIGCAPKVAVPIAAGVIVRLTAGSEADYAGGKVAYANLTQLLARNAAKVAPKVVSKFSPAMKNVATNAGDVFRNGLPSKVLPKSLPPPIPKGLKGMALPPPIPKGLKGMALPPPIPQPGLAQAATAATPWLGGRALTAGGLGLGVGALS